MNSQELIRVCELVLPILQDLIEVGPDDAPPSDEVYEAYQRVIDALAALDRLPVEYSDERQPVPDNELPF